MQQHDEAADWPIADGMTVFSLDGDALGTIHAYDPQGDYLSIQRAHGHVRVPFDAVFSLDPGCITLNIETQLLQHDATAPHDQLHFSP